MGATPPSDGDGSVAGMTYGGFARGTRGWHGGRGSLANGGHTKPGAGLADGVCAGGGGGSSGASVIQQYYSTIHMGKAGSGGDARSSGAVAGSAADANSGCGGGGAGRKNSTAQRNGGNGGSGVVRVVWFE